MPPSAMEVDAVPLATKALDDTSSVTKRPDKAVHGSEDMTPMEALSHGGLVIQGRPKFEYDEEERRHILVHMAATFRQWARLGFTEGISGHISVRDPVYDHCIWMNPLGKHFGLLVAGDMVCIDMNDGKVVGGNRTRPVNRAGYFIHSEIHHARPDVHAICHAHTVAGKAWAAFGRPLEMLTQDFCNFYKSLAVYDSYGGIVCAEEEGANIAGALGAHNKAAILMNHGLITVGSTVDEAGFLFSSLDRHCEIQLKIEAACAGNPSLRKHIISDEEAAYNFKMQSTPDWLYVEAQPDLEYEIEMAGGIGIIGRDVDLMEVDEDLYGASEPDEE